MKNINASIIEGFQSAFLWKNFDGPKATPECHREWWKLSTGSSRYVAIAAPRNHAKSTAITHTSVVAQICFRVVRHVLIVSDTESQAADFLGDIKREFLENELLREEFAPAVIETDSNTEFVFEFADGHWVRIIAKGSGQKLRGMKHNHTRPDYVVCDDLENDDNVANKELRDKLEKWFYGALLPVMSRTGRIRVVGTILHFDGLLSKLLRNKKWKSRLYEACNDDFSVILWPERWSAKDLKAEHDMMASSGRVDEFYREYRNKPMADSSKQLDPRRIKDMPANKPPLIYYAAVDAAASSQQRRDYSVISIIGLDHAGCAYIAHIHRERMDIGSTVDLMFTLQGVFDPVEWLIESGTLKYALQALIAMKELETGMVLPLSSTVLTPTKDKEFRAKPLAGRIKAGTVYADKKSEWWPAFEEELERFPASGHDDQVDAVGLLFWKLHEAARAKTREQAFEDEMDRMYEYEPDEPDEVGYGRDPVTGY